MKTFLILTHDIENGYRWISKNLNAFILDEREVAKLNANKFALGWHDLNYSSAMVEEMRIKQLSWKSSKDLAILMDMRHQTATAKIGHSVSILLYDGQLSRRIAYNPTYVTDFTINPNDDMCSVLLQILS